MNAYGRYYQPDPFAYAQRRTTLRTTIPTHGFGLGPQQVVPVPVAAALGRYDQVYPIPYGYMPSASGVSLVPAGALATNPLRPFDRRGIGLALGDALVAPPQSPADPWRPDTLPCSTNSSSCGASRVGSYMYDTKDIVIRGKARVIRQSYLHESPKFEGELSKYLGSKSKEQIPERVVDLLLDFINSNVYVNHDVMDEVTLNILAFNVGCRSVCDFSLKRLKDEVKDLGTLEQWGKVTATILMCAKVDGGLTEVGRGLV